jgi:hypothetical protein
MRTSALFGFCLIVSAAACRMAHDNEREQPMGPSTVMSSGAMSKPSAAPSAPTEGGGPTALDAGRAGHM